MGEMSQKWEYLTYKTDLKFHRNKNISIGKNCSKYHINKGISVLKFVWNIVVEKDMRSVSQTVFTVKLMWNVREIRRFLLVKLVWNIIEMRAFQSWNLSEVSL